MQKTIPFFNRIILDKEEMLEIIEEIRLKMPEDLKQARWVKRRTPKNISRSTKRS